MRRLVWLWCLALVLVAAPSAEAKISAFYGDTHISAVGDEEGDNFFAGQRDTWSTVVTLSPGSTLTDAPPKHRCTDGICTTYEDPKPCEEPCPTPSPTASPPPCDPPCPTVTPTPTASPDPNAGYGVAESGARSVSISTGGGGDAVNLQGHHSTYLGDPSFGFTTSVHLGPGDDQAVVGNAFTAESQVWQGGEGRDTLGLAGAESIDLAGGSATFADLHGISVAGFEDCNCSADVIRGTEGPNTILTGTTAQVSARGGGRLRAPRLRPPDLRGGRSFRW